MTPVLYDRSFEGLLTAVFEVYEYKIEDPQITKEDHSNGSLFGNAHIVNTNGEKAKRVWIKLEQKISKTAITQFYKSFLSEQPGIENILLCYVQYIMASKNGVENKVPPKM